MIWYHFRILNSLETTTILSKGNLFLKVKHFNNRLAEAVQYEKCGLTPFACPERTHSCAFCWMRRAKWMRITPLSNMSSRLVAVRQSISVNISKKKWK